MDSGNTAYGDVKDYVESISVSSVKYYAISVAIFGLILQIVKIDFASWSG